MMTAKSEPQMPDGLTEIAWHDACLWAFQQPDAHKAFRGATGRPQASATGTFMDALVDRAVGGAVDDAYMVEFVDWFTREHWGVEDAPRRWREAHDADGKS